MAIITAPPLGHWSQGHIRRRHAGRRIRIRWGGGAGRFLVIGVVEPPPSLSSAAAASSLEGASASASRARASLQPCLRPTKSSGSAGPANRPT